MCWRYPIAVIQCNACSEDLKIPMQWSLYIIARHSLFSQLLFEMSSDKKYKTLIYIFLTCPSVGTWGPSGWAEKFDCWPRICDSGGKYPDRLNSSSSSFRQWTNWQFWPLEQLFLLRKSWQNTIESWKNSSSNSISKIHHLKVFGKNRQ